MENFSQCNIMSVAVLRDSIDTSIKLGLFGSREEAAVHHIFKSKHILVATPANAPKTTNDDKTVNIYNLNNFNPGRLKDSAVKAYPVSDRPRGSKDISSVKYQQKLISDGIPLEPIFIHFDGKNYTLLDGAHRIVACYIERRRIPAFIVE